MRYLVWIKKEFLHVLPIFLFFLIFFCVINRMERFFFVRAGLAPISFTQIVVAAALVAKVFLVIDHMPFSDLFPNKPLIYNIIWKTILYCFIIFIVRFSIQYVSFLLEGDGKFTSNFDWRLFITIQNYYLLVLFLFVTSREFALAIGPQKVWQLLFGKR